MKRRTIDELVVPKGYKVRPYNNGEILFEYSLNLSIFGHQDEKRANGQKYVIHPYEVAMDAYDLLHDKSRLEWMLNKLRLNPKERFGVYRSLNGSTIAEGIISALVLHDLVENHPTKYSLEYVTEEEKKPGIHYLPELFAEAGDAGTLIIAILSGLTRLKTLEERVEDFDAEFDDIQDYSRGLLIESGTALFNKDIADIMAKMEAFLYKYGEEQYFEYIERILEFRVDPSIPLRQSLYFYAELGGDLGKGKDWTNNMGSLSFLDPLKQLKQGVKAVFSGLPHLLAQKIFQPKFRYGIVPNPRFILNPLLYYNPDKLRPEFEKAGNVWPIKAVEEIIRKGTFEGINSIDNPNLENRLGFILRHPIQFARAFKRLKAHSIYALDREAFIERLKHVTKFMTDLDEELRPHPEDESQGEKKEISINELITRLEDQYKVDLSKVRVTPHQDYMKEQLTY